MLFGLIHGFAFASAFGELITPGAMIGTLFAFNLGVEAGQIIVIISTFALLAALRWLGGNTATRFATLTLATLIFVFGLHWTFERALSMG